MNPYQDPTSQVNLTDWALTEGGKALHASWRDRMIGQGRDVSVERMHWETLADQDKALDQGIARDAVLAYLTWLASR